MVAKKSPARKNSRRRTQVPPRSAELVQGNDDLDLSEGVAITLRDGIAGLRPVAFSRMSPALQHLAAEMIQNVGTQRRLASEFEQMVEHARRHGMSWASIGWCAGMTAQGAQKRWGTDA